ncbi:MAG: molybdopterin-guanine dinucleotide biosynthesis protein B [Pseudomonadota bacterium]
MTKPLRGKTPIIAIAGWKKSGKTTLTSRLVAEFTQRGLRIAAVKHAHEAFQIDDGETDSARHRRAGAAQVAVVSKRRWAIISELDDQTPEPDFETVIEALQPADLIIVEGYKTAPVLKIEARRAASLTRRPLSVDDPLVIAIAADHDGESIGADGQSLPRFGLDDIGPIADFIAEAVFGTPVSDDHGFDGEPVTGGSVEMGRDG